MYRRRTRNPSKNSQSSSGNRGSDIYPPNNTSLIVQRSKSDVTNLELPRSVTAILYEDDSDSDTVDLARPSTSLMNSLKEKQQSTPKKRPVLSDSENLFTSQINNIFLSTILMCGTEIVCGNGSFKLCEDQEVFCRKLNATLVENKSAEQFLASLTEYWNDEANLKKLLMLTQTSHECDVARGPVQEPLLRLLCMVDILQSNILNLLVSRIKDLINNCTDEKECCHLISGILRQARCLSRVSQTPHFASKLFSLLESSPTMVSKEILTLLPELVTEEERKDVASKLVNLLDNGKELTPFVVDGLGNLALNDNVRMQVRDQVLTRLGRYPLTFVPNLIQFILNRIDPSEVGLVVAGIRNNLSLSAGDSTRNVSQIVRGDTGKISEANAKALCSVFDILKKSLMASKLLTDVWLKELSAISTAAEATSLDLMILIIIHGYVIGRKNSSLTVLRNRIRAGVFTDSLPVKTFKSLRAVVLLHNREVLEMSSSLLKSFEQNVSDFAISMYQEMFAVSGQFLRQDVISDAVAHLTTGAPCAVRNALNLLMRMREKDRSSLNGFAATFVTAFRVLPKLELQQARQLADIVGSVIMTSAQEDSGLVEEMLIFIRKQMSSWQQDAQHRGIIAAIMAVKHAAINVSQSDFYEKFQLNFVLKMASGAQSVCGTRRGFFLDELATMMKDVAVRPPLLSLWAERAYNCCKEHFFITDLDLECSNFPMSLQYSIEDSGNLVFPIVGFVVKPSESLYINVWSVPAAMRLLWCSESEIGRLESILCAAVILPDAAVFDNFLAYSPGDQKLIMDCLFLCANYFIECINALSSQKTTEKLVIRLKQLIEVRKLIVKHLASIPEYSPPVCQFHFNVPKTIIKKPAAEGGKKPRGRKRKSNGAEADPGNASHMDASVLPATSAAAPAEAIAQLAPPPSQLDVDLAACAGHFRELSCSAFRLLRMELKLNPTKVFKKKKLSDLLVADVSWSYRPEDKPELGATDTLYLLQDYLIKSDMILREKPHFLQKKPMGLNMESMTSSMFIGGCIKLLPKFCLKLDVVNRYCKDLLEANDGIWDAPGCFPEGSADIKMSFCCLLNIISDIVSWKSFQYPTHQKLLTDTMMTLARKSASSATQSTNSLAVEAAHYLAGLCESLPLLWGGVCLTRALHSCILRSGSKDFNLVGEVCGKLLKRPWFTVKGAVDGGVSYNQHLDSILRLHLSCAGEKLATVLQMAQLAANEVPGLVGKDATLNSYSAFNRGNFPVMYRALCESLVTATTDGSSRRSATDEQQIQLWCDVTRALTLLVDIAKALSSRTILAALLKRSQAIIQMFLGKGLPIMETALRIKSEDVLCVLKSLQGVTRFLNAVCCHSKLTNDAVVTAHVPHIRALCERLTLEVKGVLILNKIPLEFFTIAVLKNRDLHGNDIPSQSTMAASDDESELPEENDDPADMDVDVTDTED